MGADKATAIQAAQRLNAQLIPADADLVEQVTNSGAYPSRGRGKTWAHAVSAYVEHALPELDLGQDTARKYRTYLRRLHDCALKNLPVDGIEVKDVADALDTITSGKRMRNVYHQQAIEVFRYTIQLGWRRDPNNPAEATRKEKTKRQRERLTREQYDAIWAQAPHWARVGMDLALQTLQRIEDVSTLQYTDIRDGALYVVQQKTGARIRIALSGPLEDVIERSRADSRACPYIVHYRPRRLPPRDRWAAGRTHPLQVMDETLSRAFSAARDRVGVCAHLPARRRPSFHEIRSLGAALYRDQGWPEDQVQQLLGHRSLAMTAGYLEGHETPWTDVSSGLCRE